MTAVNGSAMKLLLALGLVGLASAQTGATASVSGDSLVVNPRPKWCPPSNPSLSCMCGRIMVGPCPTNVCKTCASTRRDASHGIEYVPHGEGRSSAVGYSQKYLRDHYLYDTAQALGHCCRICNAPQKACGEICIAKTATCGPPLIAANLTWDKFCACDHLPWGPVKPQKQMIEHSTNTPIDWSKVPNATATDTLLNRSDVPQNLVATALTADTPDVYAGHDGTWQPKSCSLGNVTVEDGHVVRGEGDNYCNRCECVNGALNCTNYNCGASKGEAGWIPCKRSGLDDVSCSKSVSTVDATQHTIMRVRHHNRAYSGDHRCRYNQDKDTCECVCRAAPVYGGRQSGSFQFRATGTTGRQCETHPFDTPFDDTKGKVSVVVSPGHAQTALVHDPIMMFVDSTTSTHFTVCVREDERHMVDTADAHNSFLEVNYLAYQMTAHRSAQGQDSPFPGAIAKRTAVASGTQCQTIQFPQLQVSRWRRNDATDDSLQHEWVRHFGVPPTGGSERAFWTRENTSQVVFQEPANETFSREMKQIDAFDHIPTVIGSVDFDSGSGAGDETIMHWIEGVSATHFKVCFQEGGHTAGGHAGFTFTWFAFPHVNPWLWFDESKQPYSEAGSVESTGLWQYQAGTVQANAKSGMMACKTVPLQVSYASVPTVLVTAHHTITGMDWGAAAPHEATMSFVNKVTTTSFEVCSATAFAEGKAATDDDLMWSYIVFK